MAATKSEAYSALVDDVEEDEDEHQSHSSPSAAAASASAFASATPSEDLAASATPDRRGQVMVGPLPDGFLQIPEQAPFPVHQQQQMAFGGFHQSAVGILNVTVVQARLAKNYGLTKMDPFCRVRIGVMVFETPTAFNGSKTPRWNKLIQSQLAPGITDFYIEIYDERTFSMDEKIAWGMIKIKDECFEGQTVDEWFPLNGKQGDGGKEGMVQIVMQYKKGVAPMMTNPMMGVAPMMVQHPLQYAGPGGMVYGYPQMPAMMYQQQQPMVQPPAQFIQQQPQLPQQQQQQHLQQQQQAEISPASIGQINEKDLQSLKEMCADFDDDIIRSVYQQSGGNLDRAAAQLLEMSS